jgi:hypothetical protein
MTFEPSSEFIERITRGGRGRRLFSSRLACDEKLLADRGCRSCSVEPHRGVAVALNGAPT